MHRKGGDVTPGKLQTVRTERGFNEWNGNGVLGVQNPRFMCQFCERDLATTCPPAPRSGDHKTSILEEDFCVYIVVVQQWLQNSSHHEIDIALPQLSKFKCRRFRMHHMD